jgi:hypothetical protein
MRPTRNRPRDDFLVGDETAMAQRSESCFEKICGSPTSENGKAKRLPGNLEGANAREHRLEDNAHRGTPFPRNGREGIRQRSYE